MSPDRAGEGLKSVINIIDVYIGSIIQAPFWISHREAWEAIDAAYPGIYKLNDIIMIDPNGRAYAVYD